MNKMTSYDPCSGNFILSWIWEGRIAVVVTSMLFKDVLEEQSEQEKKMLPW